MNNKLILGVFSIILSIGLSLPLAVNAQSMQDGQRTLDQTRGEVGQTGQAGMTNDDGFNWMWLLPLLAIPVILYIIKKSSDSNIDGSTNEFSGSKGGRSQSDDL